MDDMQRRTVQTLQIENAVPSLGSGYDDDPMNGTSTDLDMVVFVALGILFICIQANRLVRRVGRFSTNEYGVSSASPRTCTQLVQAPQPDVLEISLNYWPGNGENYSTATQQAMAKKALVSITTLIRSSYSSRSASGLVSV